LISIDTETTGLDLYHGAKPYLVTTCDENGVNTFWEWEIDPKTRESIVDYAELADLEEHIRKNAGKSGEGLVFQNGGFDIKALETVGVFRGKWPYWNFRDTLLGGHLVNSSQPHDLASMALIYCGLNIQPLEDGLEEAVKGAKSIIKDRKEYAEWKLAKVGDPSMPSLKENAWKLDAWLPRAVARAEGYTQGDCAIVNKVKEPFDVYIGRGSKWGNPFRIGKDGNRTEVIEKYRQWIETKSDLLNSLKELDGLVLGCHCKPQPCHGDVLVELLAKRSHPWYTVCSEYANGDSLATITLHKKQEEILKANGLWEIYLERLKLRRIVHHMRERGITLSAVRTEEMVERCSKEADRCHRVCVSLSDGTLDKLPVSGASNALKDTLFGKFGLSSNKKTPKGNPSVDKTVLEYWKEALPRISKAKLFVSTLLDYRKRSTALTYMAGYRKFWMPFDGDNNDGDAEYRVLHPDLNPTGTAHLRWSSSNPNEQNVSKKGGFNLRYCFGPATGRIWYSIDAENIELRIPAYESGEEEMVDLFDRPEKPPYYGSYHMLIFDTLHPKEFAKHGIKCKKIYKDTLYQWVKNGNFAIQYGAMESSGTADRAYHVPGAQRRIQSRFRNIARLNQAMIRQAERTGYVETIPDKSLDCTRGYPIYCARTNYGRIKPTVPLNYHVSGTACWWMMKAMIRCDEYLQELNSAGSQKYYMPIQVHDELVFDFPKPAEPIEPTETLDLNSLVRRLTMLMRKGGKDIGIPTPVAVTTHPETWSEEHET